MGRSDHLFDESFVFTTTAICIGVTAAKITVVAAIGSALRYTFIGLDYLFLWNDGYKPAAMNGLNALEMILPSDSVNLKRQTSEGLLRCRIFL